MNIKQFTDFVLKGGLGSGNWGHIGRLDKRGGSAKGGGFSAIGATKFTDHSDKKALAKQITDLRNRLKSQIADVAKQLNYPASKIKYAGETYPFKVGNDNYTAAADYNPVNGVIRLFPDSLNMSGGDVKIKIAVLAHEVTHAKFQKFQELLSEQNKKINAIMEEETRNRVPVRESFIKPDGSIRDPKNVVGFEAYELQGKIYSYLYPTSYRPESLSTTGVKVSAYAKSYWDAEAKHETSTNNAINETLAEISRKKFISPSTIIHPMWQDIHDSLMTLVN